MKFYVLGGVIILYFILTIIALTERYYGNNDEIGGEDEFK